LFQSKYWEEIAMTDAAIAISTDLEDPDAIDLDRLAASLDHLRAFFCQAGDETDAASPSSNACQRIVLTTSDSDPRLDNLDPSNVDSSQLPLIAKEAA
jgi:hypothetical protein